MHFPRVYPRDFAGLLLVGVLVLHGLAVAADNDPAVPPTAAPTTPTLSLDFETTIDINSLGKTPAPVVEDAQNNVVRGVQSVVVLPPLDPALTPASLDEFEAAGLPTLALALVDVVKVPPEEENWDRRQASWRLLAASGRLEKLAAGLAAALTDDDLSQRVEVQLLLADALLRLNRPLPARALLRRLLFEGALDPIRQRDVRRQIIQTYVVGRAFADAGLAALRYQLEYYPDDTKWRLLRAGLLLATDQPGAAVNVLAGLQSVEGRLWRVFARLRQGSLTTAQVIEQLQALAEPVAANPRLEAVRLVVLAEAAQLAGRHSLQVEVTEQALLLAGDLPVYLAPLVLADLVKAYLVLGQAYFGASASAVTEPAALFAALENDTEEAAVARRAAAALLLQAGTPAPLARQVHAFMAEMLEQDGRLPLMGLLYGKDGPLGREKDLPDSVLAGLVQHALVQADHKRAARLNALIQQPPPGVSKGAWALRWARLALFGGHPDAGAAVLGRWLGSVEEIAPASLDRVMQLMFDLQALERHRLALGLFEQAAGLAQTERQQRELLFWMAESYAALQEHTRAAAFFVRSALSGGREAAQWQQSAWYRAALELEAAGLWNDARVLFQRLLVSTTDSRRQLQLRQRLQQLHLHRQRSESDS